MARKDRISNTGLTSRLGIAPRLFGFFQAVRVIEARARRQARGRRDFIPVGEEAVPHQRAIVFRAATHLSYPQSEIDSLTEQPPALPEMSVNFIGLTGPLGVLPQHYTVALIRELRRRNIALRDFFDLFNDRLIAAFYRAWTKYRIPISIERGGTRGSDHATEALQALIGFGTGHLRDTGHPDESGRFGDTGHPGKPGHPRDAGHPPRSSPVSMHTLLHYSGMLSHFPRNAVALQHMLADYFRLPIRIVQFQGRWLSIPEDQRSRLGGNGRRGRFVTLGADAAVGEAQWDLQGQFLIEIGPIGYPEFVGLMPDRPKLGELTALTRLYVEPQIGFRVGLVLAAPEIPKLRLDATAVAAPRLGWNTWLSHAPATRDATDAGWYF